MHRKLPLQTQIIYDLASRLRYLGMSGDALYSFIEYSLSEDDLETYNNIRNAAGVAGYDSSKHQFDWTGYRLPRPDSLPRLSAAIKLSFGEATADPGVDSSTS